MLKWQAFCSAMCASGHLRNEPTRLCTPTDATDTHKVVAPGSTDKQTPTAAHATAVEARINSTDEPADLYASMLACAPLRPACVKVHLPRPTMAPATIQRVEGAIDIGHAFLYTPVMPGCDMGLWIIQNQPHLPDSVTSGGLPV